MRKLTPCLAALAIAALAQPPALAAEGPKPLRHLVYNFTVGISTNTAISSSGIGTGGSGVANYTAGVMDKGTISIDVIQAVDDKIGKALVLNVTEDAQNGRTAAMIPCIVYGDGNIVFDPTLKLNDEERSLIKYLGRGFYDSAKLDAANHWQVAKSDAQGKLQSDYTVKSSNNGILNIDVVTTMTIIGAEGLTSSANGAIVYDGNKTVLKSLHEETIDRHSEGLGKYNTTRTQVDATLTSDSL